LISTSAERANPVHARMMDRALELARRALGGVGPRPAVGAVIARGRDVVGEGATEARPGRHAEVVALEAAGERARGATLYCTLEPHAHHGVSPPCTEAIIRAGVTAVVSALQDPSPAVNGAGHRRLAEAGIRVVTDVPDRQRAEASELIAGFAHLTATGRPLVTAKYAMTLDGKLATRTGKSRWLTGAQARARAHELRAAHDALVVGIGTVLSDDPQLTARVPWAAEFKESRPRLRVVVDSRRRLPATAALLGTGGPVLWAVASPTGEDAPAGVATATLPGDHGKVDLGALLDVLGKRGATTALVEGGAALLGSFFDAGLVDRVAVFIAPAIMGGAGAVPAVAGLGVDEPESVLRLEHMAVEQLGEDLLVTGRIKR